MLHWPMYTHITLLTSVLMTCVGVPQGGVCPQKEAATNKATANVMSESVVLVCLASQAIRDPQGVYMASQRRCL
jgi:hypothetical protein